MATSERIVERLSPIGMIKPQLLEGSASGSAASTVVDRKVVHMARLRLITLLGSGSGSATITLQHSDDSASAFVDALKGTTTIQAVVKTGSAQNRIQEMEVTGEDMVTLSQYLRAIVSYESGGEDLYVSAVMEAEGHYQPMTAALGKYANTMSPVVSTDL